MYVKNLIGPKELIYFWNKPCNFLSLALPCPVLEVAIEKLEEVELCLSHHVIAIRVKGFHWL